MDKKKLLRKLRDPHYYFPRFLRIKNKAGQIIPFTPNKAQQKLLDTVEACKKAGKPIRIIILKARQFGLSTATEGLIFQDTSTRYNRTSLIVAHVASTATNIFNMSKRFYDKLPDALRPMLSNSNAKELIFDNPSKDVNERKRNPGLGSRISIQSAESLSAGRGDTIHNLHASEVAFWRDGDTLMAGLLQAVPNLPNTMVILESTANGVGDYFYNMWKKAERGESDFIPLFFPWYEHDEYRMEPERDFKRTDEEQEMVDAYGLDDEQLSWRRWCIRNQCGNDPEVFCQEYPLFPDQAFLTTGRPRFEQKSLQQYLTAVVDGERGDVVLAGKVAAFSAHEKGYFTIWKHPVPGRKYVIGADVAEGLVTGDAQASTVWDAETFEQVARYHSQVEPDIYGQHLDALGHYYAHSSWLPALIAFENNNHGQSLMNTLKRLNYPNLYRTETFDKRTNETTQKLGFNTNPKTKPLIIDKLAGLLRDRLIETSDAMFLSECFTYIRGDDGSTDAQAGCHDDLVMASAIALFICSTYVSDYFDTNNPLKAVITEDHLPHALRSEPVYPSIYDL